MPGLLFKSVVDILIRRNVRRGESVPVSMPVFEDPALRTLRFNGVDKERFQWLPGELGLNRVDAARSALS
jgi:hypothetical protein